MQLSEVDLKNLSRMELVELAKLCDEQEAAYDENRLDLYKPHKGQEAFHKSDKRIRLLVTGNRYGKTTCAVMEGIWLGLGIHPYKKIQIPNRGKIYGESFPVIMETIAAKFKEWLPNKMLASRKPFVYNQMGHLIGVNLVTGSEIKIGSYDQDIEKAEGSDWDWIMFDEPPKRELYIANLRGTIDRGAYMWFSMTPLSEAWIFDELWLPGLNGTKSYIDCFGGSSSDNPHIDKEALKLFLDELTPEERDVRYEGKFARLRGLVIDTFNYKLSEIDPFTLNSDFVIYEGLDPHASKPNAALWKAIDKDGFRYSCAELDFDGGIYDFGCELAAVRQRLTKNGAVLIKSVTDSSVNTKDMQFKINQLDELKRALRDCGEVVMPISANKKNWLLPGIQKLRDLFRPIRQANEGSAVMPTEFIFKNCVPRYRYELDHYRWPDVQGLAEVKPIKKDDEQIDCSRYIESVAPKFVTPGQSQFIKTYNGAYRRAV